MTHISKLALLPIVLFSACVEYDAGNFVGFENGVQVYSVPVKYDVFHKPYVRQNWFNNQIRPYCPEGYREISRTEAEPVSQSSAGFHGGVYVAATQVMSTVMTFSCVGAPAVQEAQ
jgi:hypothetical protein